MKQFHWTFENQEYNICWKRIIIPCPATKGNKALFALDANTEILHVFLDRIIMQESRNAYFAHLTELISTN